MAPVLWAALASAAALPGIADAYGGAIVRDLPIYGRSQTPSGIDSLPNTSQALAFVLCYVGIAVVAYVVSGVLEKIEQLLPDGWYENWQKTWPLMGAIYMAAGVFHFTAAAAFKSIYPPLGTWGFWNLPGDADFHVAWTGVAELVGGAGLFIGAIVITAIQWDGTRKAPLFLRSLHANAALGLLLLTLVVTPANIYMYTHGAQMTGLTPGNVPIPVEGHYARGALQGVLLAFLYGYYEYAKPKPGDKFLEGMERRSSRSILRQEEEGLAVVTAKPE
jgi:uncharacterized membrane protein